VPVGDADQDLKFGFFASELPFPTGGRHDQEQAVGARSRIATDATDEAEASMQRFQMRGLILGLAALFATTGAQALNIDQTITAVGGTNFYGAVHTDSGDFIDTITLVIDGALSASVSLITIGADHNNIDFVSAKLNGTALTLTSLANGFLETGFLETTSFSGPLILEIRGRSDATQDINASYSGTINIAFVPEPSTALLMGLGLTGLAVASRRAQA
jgi:hypothetical protein